MKSTNVLQVRIVKNHEEVGLAAANLVAAEIALNPNLVLGLPTGATPIPMYEEMCKKYSAGILDCSGVTTVNLDEYVGRGKGDPDSYDTFMKEQLFNHVPFKKSYLPKAKPDRPLFGDELTEFLLNECVSYTDIINILGGIDVQVLGIGTNSHIGFNEPSDEITENTVLVPLTCQTVSDNAKKFYDGDESAVPRMAISMGMKQILRAKDTIILIANGESKAKAIYDSLYGPITPQVPASLLRTHHNVIFIIDEAAASML